MILEISRAGNAALERLGNVTHGYQLLCDLRSSGLQDSLSIDCGDAQRSRQFISPEQKNLTR
jgi:hypothetical protein